MPTSFWIQGVPSTFATSGEPRWKAAIVSQAPRPTARDASAQALSVEFITPPSATGHRSQDLDNLMEPTLAGLVGQVRWFGGTRPQIDSWYASLRHGEQTGAHITVLDHAHGPLDAKPLIDEVYAGPLATSATSADACDWACKAASRLAWKPREVCGLELAFSCPTLNVGEIATGAVKATIDCLSSWLGGTPGKPADDRVRFLLVRRGVTDVPGNVRVRLFEYVPSAITTPKSMPSPASQRCAPASEVSRHVHVNPYRPGTRLHLVFDAALKESSIEQTCAALESLARGAGARLGEYLSDLRTEHHVAVRVGDGRLRLLK